MKASEKNLEAEALPDGWDYFDLGEVCEIFGRIGFRGYTIKDIVGPHEGAIAISPSNIKAGRVDFKNCTYISWFKYEESPEIKIFNDDILLVKTGSTFGKTAIVENLTQKATLNPQLVVLKKHKVNSKLLGYAMNFKVIQQQISAAIVGGAIPTLSQRLVAQFKLPLPSSSKEQRAIATALTDADALITALDQIIAKKRDLKQAAMQQLLTGKKRLPGFSGAEGFVETTVGLIPKDWRLEKVGEISVVGRGRVISHREISTAISPFYPVYSSQTSDSGIMGYLDTFDFEGEYITWTTDGANAGTFFHRTGKFNCTNVCGTIKLAKDNPSYVARVLAGIAPRHVSRNLGNPKLMNDIVKRLTIPLPSLPEQTAIAEVLSDMDAEIAALEQRRDKTRAIKQGMMQELLTGKVRLV